MSRRPGLPSTQTTNKRVNKFSKAKTRLFAGVSLLLLAAVFSATAVSANTDRGISGVAASIFSFFGGSNAVQPIVSPTPPSTAAVGDPNEELARKKANAAKPDMGAIRAPQVVSNFSGTTIGGPVWNRPQEGLPPTPPLSGTGTAVPYSVTPFTVSATGSYIITSTQATAGYDTFIFLYQNSFDASDQFTNVLAGDDDFVFLVSSQITFTLNAGTTYYLVNTGFGNGDFGNWTMTVDGPGTASTGCATAPAGMVAWYPGEANANDIIGDPANNGAQIGGLLYSAGKVGNAFNMFTNNSFVQVPASTGLNVGSGAGITLDAWINPNSTASAGPIAGWRNTALAQNGVVFDHSFSTAGDLRVNIIDTGGNNHPVSTAGGVVTASVWQHVAFTYDNASGAYAFYVNGANVGSGTTGAGFTPQTGAGYDFFIGRRAGTNYDGLMDEVEVFSRALTPQEVGNISSADSAGKCHVSTIEFDMAAQNVAESAGTVTLTMKRIGAHDTTATASFATAPGTATGGASCGAGVDFVNFANPNVTFSPGETTQTASVTICSDAIDENNEDFTGNILAVTGTGVSIGAIPTQTVTITDDDAPAAFSVSDVTQAEGKSPDSTTFAFTINKTGGTSFSSDVTYSTSDVTATAPSDYVAIPSTTVTFAPNETSKTVNVTVKGDNVVEPDETFRLNITAVTNGTGVGQFGTGTIVNDDATVQFSGVAYSVGEGNPPGTTTATFTLVRGPGSATNTAFNVDAATVPHSVSGTAVDGSACAPGIDYIRNTGETITFNAGDTSKPFNVTVCRDLVFELDETFDATLSNPVPLPIGSPFGSISVGSPSLATMTILNDDAAPTFFFTTVTTVTHNEGTGGTSTTFAYNVRRSGATELDVDVNWSVAGSGVWPATPDDFIATNGAITFPASLNTTENQSLNVEVAHDDLYEPDETFTVSLDSTNPPAYGTIVPPSTATGNIVNDDAAPTFAIDSVSRAEGDPTPNSSAFNFTITKTSGDAQYPQVVSFNTSDGTATGTNLPPPAPGFDYTTIPTDSRTFVTGETTKIVPVIVYADTVFETDETFFVNLTGVTNGTIPPAGATGTGTILNDDAAPIFSIDNQTVTEGNPGDPGSTTMTFTVTRSGNDTELPSIVNYNTVDGTVFEHAAIAPGDYTAVPAGSVSFAAGPSGATKTITIVITRDKVYELQETFICRLNNVTNGQFLLGQTDGVGTINDDEVAPNLSINDVTQNEGNSGTTPFGFTVTRTFTGGTVATEVGSTLKVNTADGSATQPSDYARINNANLVFTPSSSSQPITVSVVGDTINEPDETFTVNLTTIAGPGPGATNGYNVLDGSGLGTILNDDAPTITIGNVTQAEGNSGQTAFTFTITRTGDMTLPSSVNYSTPGTLPDTATPNVDYTPIVPGNLLFAVGQATRTLTVFVNGDLTVEPDETFRLVLAGASNAIIGDNGNGVGVGVGTIVNDDGVPISISGNIQNYSPAGPLANVTVNLTGTVVSSTTTDASGNYAFVGLPSGGNYLVTPTMAGKVFSPLSRSYSGISASVTNANFLAYNAGAVPRNLRVVDGGATPGSPTSQNVGINLTSQGDEASLSFSLSYNPARLSNPVVTCGTAAPLCTGSLVANTSIPGQIGISVDADNSGVFAAGDRNVLNISFNTVVTTDPSTPVNFTDVPTIRRTSDLGGNPLPTTYTDGFVLFAQGTEADLSARSTGNGTVDATDLAIIRQMVAGLIQPNAGFNEFQRADSAPSATKGDGQLTATDIVQARRYAAALDPLQTAGGPFTAIAPPVAPPASAAAASVEAPSVGRTMRVVSTAGTAGSTVTVPIDLDSQGNETAAGFSLTFDTTILSLANTGDNGVVLGPGLPAGYSLTVNALQAASGKVGIIFDGASNNPVQAGTKRVILVTFNVAPGAPAGQTPVNFGSSPIGQSTSDGQGNPLTTAYENGFVVLGSTAAGVSVSGRVASANGQGLRNATVFITDSQGNRRTVLTNSFGTYRFDDVEAGGTYLIGVSAKRYRFESRVLQVTDNVADVDFTGEN